MESRNHVKLRTFQEKDFAEVLRLFYDTVRNINSRDYTTEQISAWVLAVSYTHLDVYKRQVFECADEKVCGIPFTCYYNLEFAETADIEVCVPVSSSVFGNGIQTKTIEGVRTIGVKHIGAYENLGMAYKSLFDYANENNLDYIAPIIEFYDKSMGYTLKGNPDKYETRIYLPIKK